MAVEECDCRFGLQSEGEFVPLSNFKVDILREVEAGPMSGYLCAVTYYTGKDLG